MNQNIIPITDEQAKAIQEIAKTLGISLETIQKFGGFLYEIVGAPVKDLVDLKIRDPLKIKHFENLIKITEKAQESLKARNIQEPKPVSLVLAEPLLEAAAKESREELQDLWAKLLANAMDPARSNSVRPEFIEAVKKFHPTDAAILEKFYIMTGEFKPSVESFMSNALGISTDAVSVSLNNLERIGCVGKNTLGVYLLIAFGRELMRACAP